MDQHQALHHTSRSILTRSAGHICKLEEGYATWTEVAAKEYLLDRELDSVRVTLSSLRLQLNTENYNSVLRELVELEGKLDSIIGQRSLIRDSVATLTETVSSPVLVTLQNSPLDYEVGEVKEQVMREKERLVQFR